MLSNFHTHSVFCDGTSTVEESVLAAIEKGFCALGFSGHGYTDFDLSYCMKDEDGYIREIKRLKEAYKDKIEIYLGIEEDAFHPVDRARFDYIIGSSHYVRTEKEYLPIDSSGEHFRRCLDAFDGDALRFAEAYYESFCAYIHARRPDIIGHFDLITKYDEVEDSIFLASPAYNALAEHYIGLAADDACIFEVNTGAMARTLRKTPYPAENLLHVLKKKGARVILSADSHAASTLDFAFDEVRHSLREIGFRQAVTMKNGKFVNYAL